MVLQVDLVSPEGPVYSAEAAMVVARSADGDIAFQTGHVPFVGVLQADRVKVFLTDGSEQLIAVHRGFVEVSENKVTILSDVAELAEHLDPERARAALERAREAIAANIEAGPEVFFDKLKAETRLKVHNAVMGTD
jgi:F-type H+-transporting ATPase subunit epsilon